MTTATDNAQIQTLSQVIQALIAKADPAQVRTLLADTALSTMITAQAAKAHEAMDGAGFKQVEDLWDVAPDSRADLRRVPNGPGRGLETGIPVGEGVAMSGGGAEDMAGRFSRPASQDSTMRAFEDLGRKLNRMMIATKALLDVSEGQQASLALAVKSIGDLNTRVDALVAKAEDGEDEDEKKKREKEAAKASEEARKEQKEEKKEATEDEKATCRVYDLVRRHLSAAQKALTDGLEARLAGDAAKATEHGTAAMSWIEQSRPILAAAKALDPNGTPPVDLLKGLVSAENDARLLATVKSEAAKDGNQKKWPAADDKAGDGEGKAALGEIIGRVEKALAGIGMLHTDLAGMMNVIGRQPRGSEDPPPVFELAKATPDVMAERRAAVQKMHMNGDLDDEDYDRAMDAMVRIEAAAGGRLNEGVALAMLQRAPAVVRALFAPQAA